MIKINQVYTYESMDRVEDEFGNRLYNTPTGPLPSVTTILDITNDNAALDAWRQRVGDKKADQIRDEATGLGSLLHTHLENYIQGIPRQSGANVVRKLASNMADQIINRGLVKINEVWGLESQLYYDGLFAGTTDLIALYDGVPSILDYKTSKKIKAKKDIENYFCQLVAYAMAHNNLHGTDIKQGVIFMVTRDLEFETYIISGDEFDYYQDKWLHRLEKYYNAKQQAPERILDLE